jgi:hypothetical protein
MFDNEVAICIKTAEGSLLSFFMPKDVVVSFSSSGDSAIPVEVVDREGDCDLVALPRRTFEGTNVARVPSRALRFA